MKYSNLLNQLEKKGFEVDTSVVCYKVVGDYDFEIHFNEDNTVLVFITAESVNKELSFDLNDQADRDKFETILSLLV